MWLKNSIQIKLIISLIKQVKVEVLLLHYFSVVLDPNSIFFIRLYQKMPCNFYYMWIWLWTIFIPIFKALWEGVKLFFFTWASATKSFARLRIFWYGLPKDILSKRQKNQGREGRTYILIYPPPPPTTSRCNVGIQVYALQCVTVCQKSLVHFYIVTH